MPLFPSLIKSEKRLQNGTLIRHILFVYNFLLFVRSYRESLKDRPVNRVGNHCTRIVFPYRRSLTEFVNCPSWRSDMLLLSRHNHYEYRWATLFFSTLTVPTSDTSSQLHLEVPITIEEMSKSFTRSSWLGRGKRLQANVNSPVSVSGSGPVSVSMGKCQIKHDKLFRYDTWFDERH